MKAKLAIATVSVLVVGLLVTGAASGAFVAIYRNALETTAQRAEVTKLAGKECTRGGAKTTLLVTVGKLTEECAYKTPVVGQDLEIAATGSISPFTPPAVAKPTITSAWIAMATSSTGRRPNRSLRPPRIGAQTNCIRAKAASNNPTHSDAPDTVRPDSLSTRDGTIGTTRPKPSASITSVMRMNRTEAA